MTLANDSILVTPGSGATVATHTIASKEYEVWMLARHDGHLRGSGDLWAATEEGAIFPVNTENLTALWNASGSGVTLEVVLHRVVNFNANNDAASPGALFCRMFRITTIPSAGSTITPAKLSRSGASSLPSQVTAYAHGVTATPVGVAVGISNIPLNGGGQLAPGRKRMFGKEFRRSEVLTLAEDEGVVVQRGDNNNVAENGAQSLVFRVI